MSSRQVLWVPEQRTIFPQHLNREKVFGMTESRLNENDIRWVARYFLVAYLLVGDPAEAVASLEDVIDHWQTVKDDEEEFLTLVARSACRPGYNSCPQAGLRPSGFQVDLPRELHHVLDLPSSRRHCFVLHLCERIPIPMCARILNLTIEDVNQHIRAAVIQLAGAHSPVCTP